MSMTLNKSAYVKLIEEDLEYLNKNCKDGNLELDHIKAVLCKSIDLLYPEHPSDGMEHPITIKKEYPYCKLCDLDGVEGEIDAYWIDDVNDIEPTLELGAACTCADSNGSITVWKNANNEICATLQRYCIIVKQCTFNSYEEMKECISEWIEDIK